MNQFDSQETLIYADASFKACQVLFSAYNAASRLYLARHELDEAVISYFSVIFVLLALELVSIQFIWKWLLLLSQKSEIEDHRRTKMKIFITLSLSNLVYILMACTKLVAAFLNLNPIYYKNKDILLDRWLITSEQCMYLAFGLFVNFYVYVH